MAHTPGPWRVFDNWDQRYYPHRVQPDGAPYFDHIANVRGPNADEDARLIAAAPKLLEALEWLVYECDTNFIFADDVDSSEYEALEAARAAIAVAEGETS